MNLRIETCEMFFSTGELYAFDITNNVGNRLATFARTRPNSPWHVEDIYQHLQPHEIIEVIQFGINYTKEIK